MKKIFKKIVAKNSLSKPELEMVLIKKDKLVATNSYSLLEVNKAIFANSPNEHKLSVIADRIKDEEGTDLMYSPDDLGLKFNLIGKLPLDKYSALSFPQYEPLIPSNEELDEKYYKFSCNAKILAELVEALANTYGSSKEKEVAIYVPMGLTEGQAMVIQRPDTLATGVIMPLVRKVREVM